MSPIVPDRLPAGHFLSVCGVVLAGKHPDTGELSLLVEPQAGGWGAGHDKDGAGGLVSVGDGETYIIPVEVCETRYGVLVELSPMWSRCQITHYLGGIWQPSSTRHWSWPARCAGLC